MEEEEEVIMIKQIKKPIQVMLEQYECEACGLKTYINTQDKKGEFLHCPICGGEAKNVRIFEVNILGIGEY